MGNCKSKTDITNYEPHEPETIENIEQSSSIENIEQSSSIGNIEQSSLSIMDNTYDTYDRHNKYNINNIIGTQSILNDIHNTKLFFAIGIENKICIELKQNNVFRNRRIRRKLIIYENNIVERVANHEILEIMLEEYVKTIIIKQPNLINMSILLNSQSYNYNTHNIANDNTAKYNKTYAMDNDILELLAVNFNTSNVDEVITEIMNLKNQITVKMQQIFNKYNIIKDYSNIYVVDNHRITQSFSTNMFDYGSYNFGTININITLPTNMTVDGLIHNDTMFAFKHQQYIKYIQYIEPLIISIFKTPPELGKNVHENTSLKYNVGTYDSSVLERGTINKKPINQMKFMYCDEWWYNDFKISDDDELELDINFNKHYNHGVEIKFIRNVHEYLLSEIIEFLVHLGDYILDNDNTDLIYSAPAPNYEPIWNKLVKNVMLNGIEARVTTNDKLMYSKLFKTECTNNTIYGMYNSIRLYLKHKYSTNGNFSRVVLKN